VLVDRFLANAIEVDVDALCDGKQAVIAGIMEHIEEAGIHSGDSACSLPPYSLARYLVEEIERATRARARARRRRLMNVQFAIADDSVYVLEVNPRASRTAPFVSKRSACRSRSSRARDGREDARRLGSQGDRARTRLGEESCSRS